MSFTVTIHRTTRVGGKDRWVAFDQNGDWRTYGEYDPKLSGRELALYLFHSEEVGEVTVDSAGRTVVQILES